VSRHFDAVVVGSGPGGAVTARGLAAAGLDVLVLEDGGDVALGEVEPYSLEQMRRQYRGGGLTAALGSPSVAYTEGRGVGGGSEVNSALYHRPPPSLLDEWSTALDIDDLSATALARWHDHVERELGVSRWPGEQLPAASAALKRGAEALGWSGLEVPRWIRYSASASADGGVVARRQTMRETYLPAARDLGVTVEPDSRVLRIRRSADRATGVDVLRSGHLEQVRADHVFVCAGAVQTPALLQRSGWTRNVGTGLSVHPTLKVVAEYDYPVNDIGDLPAYQVKEFGSWLTLGGSASRPSLIALALAENWREFGQYVDRWQRQAVYYAAIQAVGTGRVRAVPGFDEPLVTMRLTRTDGERLRSGLARLVHVLRASGASRLYPSLAGAPVITDHRSALAAVDGFALRRASLMTVHLTGTVPLGEDRRRAAADSYGRVHSASHLRVNDASMLPWAPGVNPQGVLMAIAHRNVEHFVRTEVEGRG
jgi:choline dehydrogenase-like flavoprotein